tara:strand:+ start:4115 stop:6616 length:2502 start_codon:yes stop_codon:yes gene_type:complete
MTDMTDKKTEAKGKAMNDEPMTKDEIQTLALGKDIHFDLWNKTRLANNFIRSQKAAALAAYNAHVYSKIYEVPQTMFVLNDDNLDDVVYFMNHYLGSGQAVFTRTCPLTPRHGVLESTKSEAGNEDDLRETVSHLQNVMVENDPEGCLAVQPFVRATGSCVLAPNMYVVIGEGHDGITAGHGFRMALPLSSAVDGLPYFASLLKKMSAGTGRDYEVEKHEIEMVFDHSKYTHEGDWNHNPVNQPHSDFDGNHNTMDDVVNQGCLDMKLTQIRGCDEHISVATPPSGVTIQGMVPKGDVLVTDVWTMSGLEEVIWLEENITKEKCPEGFVVSEPNGSLLSHICAHCRTHGIPYIIGDVNEGETWTEAASGWVVENTDGNFVAQPYNPFDYIEEFRSGIEYGNTHWRRKHAHLSTFFHQWMGQPLNDPAFTAFLAGVFASWMVKAALAACVGEMRHSQSQKKDNLSNTALLIMSLMGAKTIKRLTNYMGVPSSRSYYHEWMKDTKVDWAAAEKVLSLCATNFSTGWNSSYGGAKTWGAGAKAAARVAGLIHKAVTEDDMDVLTTQVAPTLVEAVNALENAQHNNGNLLNKFGSDIKKAYDHGTGGFHENALGYAFNTWCLARDIYNDVLLDYTEEPENDWHEVCDFAAIMKPSFMRDHPIYSTDWELTTHKGKTMPVCMRDMVTVMDKAFNGFAMQWTHQTNGNHAYSDVSSTQYVPCGHKHCNLCKAHNNKVNAPPAFNPMEQQPAAVTDGDYDVYELEHSAVQQADTDRIVTMVRVLLASKETITLEDAIDVWSKAVSKGQAEEVSAHMGMLLMDMSDKDLMAITKVMEQEWE